jgi:hypothetical protein
MTDSGTIIPEQISAVIITRRHSEASIVEYADRQVLPDNISRVDEIYMWFVKVKEEMERRNGELD